NLSLSEPSSLITLQYGVMRLLPLRLSSSAASAAIRTKIPVVIGHATFAFESLASLDLICDCVISFPFGTVRITESTSMGAGISIVPVPNLFCILGGISTTFASCFLSSFSLQGVRDLNLLCMSPLQHGQ